MALQFINHVRYSDLTAFESEVRRYSQALGINPDWLMAVMEIESGCNPHAVNSVSGATGLIQFMPATAQSLGTTTAALKSMTGEQQLYYVYKYLKPYAGKIKSLTDLYLAVFFPAAIGQKDDYVLQTSKLSASKIAAQNPGYDLNKDSKITKAEVTTAITNILKKKAIHPASLHPAAKG